MAIRPTDLQLAIINSGFNSAVTARQDDAPRAAQFAAQAAFVAQTEQRNETVTETGNLQGNRIEVGERQGGRDQEEPQGRRRRHARPEDPFEEAVEDAAGFGDRPHLIDFTA